LGGTHIQYANKSSSQQINGYFQKFITGTCGSVLFLADGVQSQIISINQQYLSPTPSTLFRLGKIDTPWLISTLHRQQLKLATDKITFNTGLLGLNSLDFIVSNQGKLLILEVNPRPSASAELIHKEINLFQHHIMACYRKLPLTPIIQPVTHVSLHFIYADHDLLIPTDMTWPLECSDLPSGGTFIQKEAPICTVLLVHSDNLLPHIEQVIKKQLMVLA
ncbi:MAG: ATP-grasp domain-containing protein, partial [Methylophaga sp.]|nr:ATP-grasp domain-containing protein [Methylophaga sp.]